MTTMTMLYALGGALAVMIIMLVAVIVARGLDGSSEEGRQKFAMRMSEVAAKITSQAKERTGGANWISGQLAGTFSALAAASATQDDDPEVKTSRDDARKQLKTIITIVAVSLAVVGGVVGAIFGDS